MFVFVDFVQFKIALGPIQIGIGQIHGFAADGTACGGIHRKTARVSKQIQHPFARGHVTHHLAGIAMVKKQTSVQILVQIYPKQAAIFLYGKIVALTAGFFVLLFAFLALAHFNRHVFRLKASDKTNRLYRLIEPSLMLIRMQ